MSPIKIERAAKKVLSKLRFLDHVTHSFTATYCRRLFRIPRTMSTHSVCAIIVTQVSADESRRFVHLLKRLERLLSNEVIMISRIR